jgi:hypothetical protein
MSEELHIYTGEDNRIDLINYNRRNTFFGDIAEEIEQYFIDNWEGLGESINYPDVYPVTAGGVFQNGVFMNNLLYIMGKRNVLFVTNYNDSDMSDGFLLSDISGVTNPNATKANLGELWTPMVKHFGAFVKFTSAFKPNDMSLVKYLHGRYGVPATNCNEKYELGMTDWEIETPSSKYDVVILSGIPNPSGQVHSAEDIKSVFAPYCTDDFILFDMFESEQSRLDYVKLWPNFDVDELKRIGSERTQRIEGDKLDFIEECRTINTYSLTSRKLDESTQAFNRISDILFEYYVDIY